MQIREGMEQYYAEFTASHGTTAEGQTLLRFVETWNGMMECAVKHGAENVTEAAALTVQAAAKSAGLTEDSAVIEGAKVMLDCWSYGRGIREWCLYHPPEILGAAPDAALGLFYSSQGLRDAVPAIVEAYPCILETAPDILEVHRILSPSQIEHAAPTLSM